MQQRMDVEKSVPELYRAVVAFNRAVNDSGLEKRHLELIKLRASQINGCGYCTELHVREALKAGIEAAALHLVVVWRESSYFDARDRAVLELTEHVTLISNKGVPDKIYARAQEHFTDEEIGKLLVAIAMINVWNRLMVASQTPHDVE